ncbi:MAG TPA: sigma-70 family RNA polymerase sigma factor [Flavisolibacter sp.]
MDSGSNTDEIISGCRKGSRKAQEQLYKNYYRAMVTICLRYTKNDADAVEVLNNAFLRVFKNIQRYDPAQAGLYTWIRTIVVNSCIDFVKAKQKWETHQELGNATEVNIPAEVIGKMKQSELLGLIRRLPPATQAVFNMFAIEGYSHREIAAMTGTSEGTSKWHVSEARKILQRLIKLEQVNHE